MSNTTNPNPFYASTPRTPNNSQLLYSHYEGALIGRVAVDIVLIATFIGVTFPLPLPISSPPSLPLPFPFNLRLRPTANTA